MPGTSAIEVESPMVATTGAFGEAGALRTHHVMPLTDGPPGGHARSLVSATARAVALDGSSAVVRTITPATMAIQIGTASASRRVDAPSHGSVPDRTGRSTR